MDLLKEEDLQRNSPVIVVGYGQQYKGDDRGERSLKFTKLEMFTLNEPFLTLNITIFSDDKNSKACKGRSS